MSFKIPKEYIAGFHSLIDLSSDEVGKLCFILTETPTGTGPKNLNSILESEFKDIEDFSSFSSMLFSLGSVIFNYKDSNESLSKELTKSVKNALAPNKLSSKKIKSLEKNLLSIIESGDNLKFTFKALDLIAENNQIFRNARILTDIRLLFNDDIKEKERNALIIHQFKVESSCNGNDENYYFSLDSSDLEMVKNQIDRAIEKEKEIKENYSDISFIDITK